MLRKTIRLISRDERGQDMIEYALVGAFVAAAAVAVSPAIYATANFLGQSVQRVEAIMQQTLSH